MTTPSPAATPRRGRPRGIRIQRRRSARTGVAYLYGDFRTYADVGGAVEPLRAPGARTATSDLAEAAQLYSARVAALEALRAAKQVVVPTPPLVGAPVAAVPRAASGAPGASPMRFAAMAELHLERKGAKRSGRRASTVARDRSALKRLVRTFGDCPLSDITPQRLDEYVLAREKEPGRRKGTTVSARSIRNELHALSSMFRRAVALGHASQNPVAVMTEKPGVPDAEAEFLTEEEAGRLLDAAVELDDETRRARKAAELRKAARRYGDGRRDRRARVLLAQARREREGLPSNPSAGRSYPILEVVFAALLYTGGRISEVLGLLVEDIDFERRRVRFRPNRYRRLKRDRHCRDVELWPPLELLLRHYLARTGLTTGLLFPSRKGGMIPHFNRRLARCLRHAKLGAGRRISPHTLRHTYTAHLLQTLVPTQGGPPAVRPVFEVARRLGHRSSVLVDAVYGHLVPTPRYRETLSYEEGRAYPASRLRAAVEGDVAPTCSAVTQ